MFLFRDHLKAIIKQQDALQSATDRQHAVEEIDIRRQFGGAEMHFHFYFTILIDFMIRITKLFPKRTDSGPPHNRQQ